MKILRIVCAAAVLAAGAGFVLAEAPEAPKPGPEHQRLEYFVGTWEMEATIAENPFAPAGKVTATEKCHWFEGGFAIVCKSEGKGPKGETKSLAIMSYSTEEKAYTYYGVENSPMTMTKASLGQFKDGTFVYDDESKIGGKTVRSRYTIKELSPTSYSLKGEMVNADGQWVTMVEGTAKKVK